MNSAIFIFTLLLMDLNPAECLELHKSVWQIRDPRVLHIGGRERLVRLGFYTWVPAELEDATQVWVRTPIGERAARVLGLPGPD